MSAAPTAASSNAPLSERFPVHTLWEFELEDGGDGGESSAVVMVEGRVHCTDEFSQTVVLKRPLPHTTLAWEVRFINASAVVRATQKVDDTDEETNGGGTASASLHRPLPKVHRRALEERERKALRQAEESFRQINQQVRSGLGHGMWFCCDRMDVNLPLSRRPPLSHTISLVVRVPLCCVCVFTCCAGDAPWSGLFRPVAQGVQCGGVGWSYNCGVAPGPRRSTLRARNVHDFHRDDPRPLLLRCSGSQKGVGGREPRARP